jgi:hypothetical protein
MIVGAWRTSVAFIISRVLRVLQRRHFLPGIWPRMDLAGVYTEVLIRSLDAIEANQPPLIFGDRSQSMDFVYGGDAACLFAGGYRMTSRMTASAGRFG